MKLNDINISWRDTWQREEGHGAGVETGTSIHCIGCLLRHVVPDLGVTVALMRKRKTILMQLLSSNVLERSVAICMPMISTALSVTVT